MKSDKPSAGATRAAEKVADQFMDYGVFDDDGDYEWRKVESIAQIIDEETCLKELVEALEFYADPWEWQKRPGNEDHLRSDGLADVPDFYNEMDFGLIAEEALRKIKETP